LDNQFKGCPFLFLMTSLLQTVVGYLIDMPYSHPTLKYDKHQAKEHLILSQDKKRIEFNLS